MKKISEHLGQIIAALAAIALLIGTVAVFRVPIGNFFNSITGRETAVGDSLLAGMDGINLSDLESSSQEKVPTEIGTIHETDDYIYTFGAFSNISSAGHGGADHLFTYGDEGKVGLGWHVIVKDRSKTSYQAIEQQINGYPIVCMCECFAGCENLVTSPAIPASVVCLQRCYGALNNEQTGETAYCNSLTGVITLPDIPGTAQVPYKSYNAWNPNASYEGNWDGAGTDSDGPLQAMFWGKQSGDPIIVKYTTKCGAIETDSNFANDYNSSLIVKQCVDGEKATVNMTVSSVFTGRYVLVDGVGYVYVTEQDYTSAGFLAIDDGSTTLPNPLPSEVCGYPVIGTYEQPDSLPTESLKVGFVRYTFNPYLMRYQITRIGTLTEAPADALESTIEGYPATGLVEYFAAQAEYNRSITIGDITYSWNMSTASFTVPADQYGSAATVLYGYSVNPAA